MGEPIPTVRLKNGIEEAKPLVAVVMLSLESLFKEGKGIVFYELVEICKDSNHKPWGTAIGEDLKNLSLASEVDGKWLVHDSIRNIVLSAAEGEGLDLRLVNPVAETVASDNVPATA